MQTAIDQIRALRALHEDGLLSRQEFEQRKNALLDAVPAPAAADGHAAPGTELGLMAGQQVGPPDRRYRLERPIGRGGMGQVWQATDLATRSELGHSAQVALKILAREDGEDGEGGEDGARARLLLQEATRARRLAHEHIVRVYDWAQDPATASYFLIMEYLEGEDLGRLLAREGPLPLARALDLLEPVAAALDYAWSRHGLVHRDIKPGNVFVTDQGEVKLLDFGIAARVRGTGGNPAGEPGGATDSAVVERAAHEAPGMAGTPGYRAPEASTPDLVPARTLDVYAVARMTAQMLTNLAPSGAERDPPRPAGIDEGIWTVLREGWAPEPAARPDSVGDLLARLRAAGVLAGQVAAVDPVAHRVPVQETPDVPDAGPAPEPQSEPQSEPAPASPALAPLPAPRLGAADVREDDAQRAARRETLRAQLAAHRAAALAETRRSQEEIERLALGAKAAAAYLAEQERMAQAPAQPTPTGEAAAAPTPWRDRFLDGDGAGPELVPIRAGRFQMGSPEHERKIALGAGTRAHWLARETPQRWVGIERAFALGRYPVTVGEWRVFAEASGWRGSGSVDWTAPGFPQTDAHPVVGVSWHDAQAYLRWLSERTGRRYRLPSEAEWEYACRAGTRGPFHFGERIDTGRANYDGGFAWNGGPLGVRRGGTTPVTLFAPNPWGLHDMHGNVWEWVQDVLHDNYESAPPDGRAWEGGSGSGDDNGGKSVRRVLRGGCWRYHPRYLRSALRNGVASTMANEIVGFRVARELDGEEGRSC